MIRLIDDMPPGTIGLEATGKVTDEDDTNVLVPAITAALATNDVRLLYVLGDGFDLVQLPFGPTPSCGPSYARLETDRCCDQSPVGP